MLTVISDNLASLGVVPMDQGLVEVVKLAMLVPVDLESLVWKDWASPARVALYLLIRTWKDLASIEAVNLASHLAVDLAVLGVGRIGLFTAQGGIN